MHHIYVLKSRRNGKRYVGCTGKSPEQRLIEHNRRGDNWTRQNGPFDLIYSESYAPKKEALIRERFLKSGVGRQLLDKLFPGSSVGRAGDC